MFNLTRCDSSSKNKSVSKKFVGSLSTKQLIHVRTQFIAPHVLLQLIRNANCENAVAIVGGCWPFIPALRCD